MLNQSAFNVNLPPTDELSQLCMLKGKKIIFFDITISIFFLYESDQ